MSNQPPFGDPPPPGGWGSPPGGQQPPGGWNPQGPTEPFPPQGQPGYGQQPGYGGAPPPGYGQPPGYGEGPPPGYGGPGGFQGPPPSKSNAPLIVGIIAAVLILGGAAGAFVLLSGDDDPVTIATATPQATASVQPTEAPTADPTPSATATPEPRPTSTMPEPPPEPTAAPLPPAPPAPPPAPPGSSMDMGEGLQGEITDAALVQEFFFDGLTGEEIVLTMTALDDSLDPVLTLFAPDGAELERNDDDFDLPTGTDSRIQVQLPADGEYRVEASSFASTTGRFELTLEFPSVLSATDTLSASVPEIVYDYEGTAGQTVVINMRALDDEVDPLVYVLDAQGVEIGRDDDGGSFPNSRLQLTLPSDGTYTIVASTFGERYGQFELTLSAL